MNKQYANAQLSITKYELNYNRQFPILKKNLTLGIKRDWVGDIGISEELDGLFEHTVPIVEMNFFRK